MKKQIETTVIGTYTGNDNNGSLEWRCPFTGETKEAWGEFRTERIGDAWFILHDVTDENDNFSYTVEAALL